MRVLSEAFTRYWETNELPLPKDNRSLTRPLLHAIKRGKVVMLVLASLVMAGTLFACPLLMKAISKHMSGENEFPPAQLWTLVALTFVIPVVGSIIQGYINLEVNQLSIRARNIFTSALYLKISKLRSSSCNLAMMKTMFTVDIRNIEGLLASVSIMTSSPAVLVVALGLIYREVGPAMFAGLGLVVGVSAPLSLLMLLLFSFFRKRLFYTDLRVKATTDALNGVRVVKYYAWEAAFQSAIEKLRAMEMGATLGAGVVWSLSNMLIGAVPVVQPIVVFYTFIKMGGELDYIRPSRHSRCSTCSRAP